MLNDFFEAPATLSRHRAGAAGPFMDGLAASLAAAGYAKWTARGLIRGAVHFGRWAEARLQIDAWSEDLFPEFRLHLGGCSCLRRNGGLYQDAIPGARRLLEHLRRCGEVSPRALPPDTDPPILRGFIDWMRVQRGATEGTISAFAFHVRALIAACGIEPAEYQVGRLRSFVANRSREHGRSRAKMVVTATRAFLRYLAVKGDVRPALAAAIPTVAEWRLSSLPRYLPSESVERIIAACDSSTPVNLRDRAVLLLLARLGLRGGDVRALRLSDIDWKAGRVRLSGKGRREAILPLPQDVGDALFAYVERARPESPDERVFLQVRAPFGPLDTSSAISCLVEKAIRKAGVEAPSHGGHILRHSAATELLRQGASLPAISRILRHRSPQTTTLYAKVDVGLLSSIAQPWPSPEVASC